MKSMYRAYLVILAGVCSALHIAKISPALPTLQLEFELTAFQAGGLISTVQFAGMLCGIMVGAIVEVWGLRNSIFYGLAGLALCSFGGIFPTTALSLLLLRGVEGMCFLLVIMPAPALLRQLTRLQDLPKTLGLWGIYMPLGMATSLLLGAFVISWLDWRKWWLLLAIFTAIIAACTLKFLPPKIKQAQQSTPPSIYNLLVDLFSRLKLTLKSPAPWLVALGFGLYSSQWLTIIGFLPSIYSSMGISIKTTGIMTAIIASANMIGNICAGRLLMRKTPAAYLLYAGFITMGICSVIAFSTLNIHANWLNGARFVAIFILSAVGGLIPGTLFFLAVELAPSAQTISTSIGWTQQISSTGQFFIPPLVGVLADARHGDWSWTWMILCACSVAGLIVAKCCDCLLKKMALKTQ